MIKPFLEVGEFVTTHGITGELKLYPWCDGPEFILQFATLYLAPNGAQPVKVQHARVHKTTCLVQLEGVHSPEAARRYIGKTVWIARADAPLPEGRFFVQDLLGAAVQDAATGEVYGRVQGITTPGRHDVYEILRPGGEKVLFPAVDAFVEKIDPANELVLINPIPGMFDGDTARGTAVFEKKCKAPRKEKRE